MLAEKSLLKDRLRSVAGMRLLLSAGLSPAQADLFCAAHDTGRDLMGKMEVLYLENPHLEFGFKSLSVSGTFCFFASKRDAAGQDVILS